MIIFISFLTLFQAITLVNSFTPYRHGATVQLPKLTFILEDSSNNLVREEIVGNHENTKLLQFLTDASAIGAVRFVVVGTGAILETIGSFENLRFSDTVKGKLITFSSENPCFECHVRVAEVKEVKNIVVQKFEKKLRVTRFIG